MAVVYGVNPVLEALKSGTVEELVVAEGRGGATLHKLLELAEEKGIKVVFRKKGDLDRLTGKAVHQGVLCFCPEFSYVSVDDIIQNRADSYRDNLILLLDSITDPQNLGSLIRTARCFDANGLIIPENRAVSVTSAVFKASAGLARQTSIARVTNLAQAIDFLKKQGFWIYGTVAESGEDIHEVDFRGNVGLVMGSEGKGIRPLIKEKCDFLVSIPMGSGVDSLNVSVAAGIILFDIYKKRDRVAPVR